MPYATTTDLEKYGLPGAALKSISATDREAALSAASAEADSYLNVVFTLPLTAWGDDLRVKVSHMAAYHLLSTRGYNPQAQGNESIERRYTMALSWLKDVSSGKAKPTGITDSSPNAANTTEESPSYALQPQASTSDGDSFWGSGGSTVGGAGSPRSRGW